MNKISLFTNLVTVIICASLSGCVGRQDPAHNVGSNQQAAMDQAEKLMRLAEGSSSQQATTFKLQAIEHLIVADSIEQAERAIKEDLPSNLDSNNSNYKQILLAQIHLAKQDLNAAKQDLRPIWTPNKLSPDLIVKFYTTRADINRRSGDVIDAVQDRITLAQYLKSPAEQKANNESIWDTLSQLTPHTLRALSIDPNKNILHGWVEFATITKQYDASSEQRQRAITLWHAQYPQHPAAGFIQGTTTNRQFSMFKSTSKAKKIALMLPLHGAHAKSAQAIRDGFLAAYYAQQANQQQPTIKIYDTSDGTSLYDIYQQIVTDGADFIVGPLTKEEVEKIADSVRPQIPMLTLNNLSTGREQENIFQFSLAPEMEAQSVAYKAWKDGRRNALVIIPKSAWGQRMLTAFQETWLQLGGKIIGFEQIQSQSDLNNGIKHLLRVDDSETRAALLKQAGIKFNFDPRRRQDVDMVFIATNAALARQVKPLLNFYYAADLPAYASSSIFSGKVQPSLDQDLNGIQFCDMPWILDDSISSRSTYKSVAALWPQDFEQYSRLYALGLDAYKIATQLEQLTMLPDLGVSGMTGMLTLDKQQQIKRKLMWASFKKGVPNVNGEQQL